MDKMEKRHGRPLKSGERRKQVAFRLPVSAVKTLDELAEKEGISRADVVAKLLLNFS